MTAKKTDKHSNFEGALERLETIVNEMESGSLSLEKMMKRFEEGMSLVKFCSEKLNEVEKKIEILVKKDGETVLAPFDAESEQAEGKADRC